MSRVFLRVALPVFAALPALAQPWTLEALEERAFPRLAVRAELARLDTETASTGSRLLEGPTIEVEGGARRGDATRADLGASIEIPLLASGRSRRELADAVENARDVALDAEEIASLFALRRDYFDAWLAQERLRVLEEQIADSERLADVVRRRIDAGAQAPYEAALVEGELLALRAEADAARAERGERWASLRRRADLPPGPEPLADPPPPELSSVAADPGSARESVTLRAALDAASIDLDLAKRRSRVSVGAALGSEGEERFAVLGVGYRFPLRGERAALAREREATLAASRRAADAELAEIDTRLRVALDRARAFGPIPDPAAFDDALRAVALRLTTGKEGPSTAIPVRRELRDARAVALRRLRDAHVLIAEIDALTRGGLR